MLHCLQTAHCKLYKGYLKIYVVLYNTRFDLSSYSPGPSLIKVRKSKRIRKRRRRRNLCEFCVLLKEVCYSSFYYAIVKCYF